MIRFEFKSKENFIQYLWFIIRSTFIQLERHRHYLQQLKSLIVDRACDEPGSKVPAQVYHDISDKIGFINLQLTNLFGDHADKAVSYKKFRHEANKRNIDFDLQLLPLDGKTAELINEINTVRNWGLHIPESLVTAEFEVRNRMMESSELTMQYNPILVGNHLYYDAKFMTTLRDENIEARKIYSTIFHQAKKDYSVLVGQPTNISWVEYEYRPIEDMISVEMSSQVQHKKYEGIDLEKISELTKHIVGGVTKKKSE